MRKTFTSIGFGALGRAAMATFGVALTATSAAYADDTIKIGALLIDSGPLAGLKEGQTKAINLAIDEINAAGGAAGKKLEADFITYPGTPDTAVDGATRAVQKDGAIFITGMDTSAVSPALAAKLPSLNALMMEVYAQADGLTGKGCSPNFFRVNVNELDADERGRRVSEGQGHQVLGHHRGRLFVRPRRGRKVQGADQVAGRLDRQGPVHPVRNR